MNQVVSNTLPEEDEDDGEGKEEAKEEKGRSRGNTNMLFFSALVLLFQGLWFLNAQEDEAHPELFRPQIQAILPSTSSVPDFTDGDLSNVLYSKQDALILLYAPWDKESLKGAGILNRMRTLFPPEEDLSLSAVNCWNTHGLCFKRFFADSVPSSNRFMSYPQWVYVPKSRTGSDPFLSARFFNMEQGSTTYDHILSFVIRQKFPLRVWKTYDEWLSDRAKFGGLSLTGHLQSTSEIKEYIRAAESLAVLDSKDAILPVGIILNKELAERINVQKLKLNWWNGSLEFPQKLRFNRTSAVLWTRQSLSDVKSGHKYLVPELQSSTSKSFLLDSWLRFGTGISLLAFLKPGIGGSHYKGRSILREAALLYMISKQDFNANRYGVRELYDAMVHQRRMEDENIFKTEAHCKSDFKNELTRIDPCPFSMYYNDSRVDYLHKENRKQRGDERSIYKAIKTTQKLKCIELAYKELDSGCISQRLKGFNDIIDESIKLELLEIHPGNKSLNFYFLNADTNVHIMNNLGLNAKDNQILIENMISQNRWKLDSPLSTQSLFQFIWDFHYRQDFLKHFRKSKNVLETCYQSNQSCIQEISSSNFDEVVIKSAKTHVVVLHQTISCYFCAAARRSLHEVKRFIDPVYFEDPSSRVIFVTIDGSQNDLPMEHTAPVYPALVFYPAGDKSKSKVYPLGEAFLSENIKKFIIGNMTPDEIIRVEAHWCGETCINDKKSLLSNAILSTPQKLQDEFLIEFEEIKRLLSVAVGPNATSYKKAKYEFIRDFRIFTNALY
ncbi:uncharacterized protein [Lepeophtheirus salmonis]|uniref:uncharacterized protein n=1 Tax=Lepeophtheirus salmonis TaxID=72036 RepID=UPI001AE4E8CA|nr:uncharacterized protein LOC121119511 [Lepeophtheirus salmonis]